MARKLQIGDWSLLSTSFFNSDPGWRQYNGIIRNGFDRPQQLAFHRARNSAKFQVLDYLGQSIYRIYSHEFGLTFDVHSRNLTKTAPHVTTLADANEKLTKGEISDDIYLSLLGTFG